MSAKSEAPGNGPGPLGPLSGADPVPPVVLEPGPPSRHLGLRIAFFTDSFEPTHDGVAKVTATLASTLLRQGHTVTVYTVRSPGQPGMEVRPDGLRIRRFRSLAAPSYPQYRIALWPWSILFSRSRFDVVHIHTPGLVGLSGWLAARRWRVPSVGTYHTNLTGLLRGAGRTGPSRAFFRAWSRFSIDLCRHCDLATAPSWVARGDLIAGASPSAQREIRVVPNGVDTERFAPGIRRPDWRERLGVGDIPIVLFLGRLTRDKGAERFLSAIERLARRRPWLALLAGEGPLRPSLERRLRLGAVGGDRVRFLGPVLEEEKPSLLAQSQVFVIPSLSDTSSVALLEAMASGVPSVVSAFGGPAEIARSASIGVIVDPRDPDDLASAIARLLEDARLARSFSSGGREWVMNHASSEAIAREYPDCYRSVRAAPTGRGDDGFGNGDGRRRPAAGDGPSTGARRHPRVGSQ